MEPASSSENERSQKRCRLRDTIVIRPPKPLVEPASGNEWCQLLRRNARVDGAQLPRRRHGLGFIRFSPTHEPVELRSTSVTRECDSEDRQQFLTLREIYASADARIALYGVESVGTSRRPREQDHRPSGPPCSSTSRDKLARWPLGGARGVGRNGGGPSTTVLIAVPSSSISCRPNHLPTALWVPITMGSQRSKVTGCVGSTWPTSTGHNVGASTWNCGIAASHTRGTARSSTSQWGPWV